MNAGRHRVYGSSARAQKAKDEDLSLFHEMIKCKKEHNVSLLQPVSELFESSQGNHLLYKFPSGKREMEHDFLTIDCGKNDYDWLKTPPATPLFPSLDLEVNDPNMVIHKELPILEPLKPSRFSGKGGDPKLGPRPEHPMHNTKPASSSYLNGSTSSKTRTLNVPSRIPNPEPNKVSNYTRPINSKGKPANEEAKPRSRGVSPAVRSRLPATLPGFTDKAPRNLMTHVEGRTPSATRWRPAEGATKASKPRQQSCSPSMAHGRRGEKAVVEKKGSAGVGSGMVVGSRMVERVMNACRGIGKGIGTGTRMDREERVAKPKITTSKANLVNMAIKHMEVKKSLGDVHQYNMVNMKSSILTAKVMSTYSTPQTTLAQEIGKQRDRFSKESKNLLKKDESGNRCGLY